MKALRRSVSVIHSRSTASEENDIDLEKYGCTSQPPHRKSSLDRLVIPGRTRYPSDNTKDSIPAQMDIRIAGALLGYDGAVSDQPEGPRATVSDNFLRVPDNRFSSGADSSLSLDVCGDRKSHLRTASDVASSDYCRYPSGHSSISSQSTCLRQSMRYITQYNTIARRAGLPDLVALDGSDTDTVALYETPKPTSKKPFWRKFPRSSSSKDLHNSAEHSLVRKNSVASLVRKGSKLALNCKSLDQFYHYGGFSILSLPPQLQATQLVIPTCLAATASYLAEHGRYTLGVFRIPGQASVVNRLYDHYASQLYDASRAKQETQCAVGSADLPMDIPCSTYDVASAYKKFLWDVPGGILGSVALFKALSALESFSLDSLHSQFEQRWRRVRLIALALLSLRSNRRIALLSSVFGLLTLLKDDGEATTGHDRDPQTPSRSRPTEKMSSKALAVVFAPILLGHLTDKIDLPIPASASRLAETPKRSLMTHFRTPKHQKSNSMDKTPEMSAGIERSNAAASVIEMLLKNWEDITAQMRLLEAIPISHRVSRSAQEYSRRPMLASLQETSSLRHHPSPVQIEEKDSTQGLPCDGALDSVDTVTDQDGDRPSSTPQETLLSMGGSFSLPPLSFDVARHDSEQSVQPSDPVRHREPVLTVNRQLGDGRFPSLRPARAGVPGDTDAPWWEAPAMSRNSPRLLSSRTSHPQTTGQDMSCVNPIGDSIETSGTAAIPITRELQQSDRDNSPFDKEASKTKLSWRRPIHNGLLHPSSSSSDADNPFSDRTFSSTSLSTPPSRQTSSQMAIGQHFEPRERHLQLASTSSQANFGNTEEDLLQSNDGERTQLVPTGPSPSRLPRPALNLGRRHNLTPPVQQVSRQWSDRGPVRVRSTSVIPKSDPVTRMKVRPPVPVGPSFAQRDERVTTSTGLPQGPPPLQYTNSGFSEQQTPTYAQPYLQPRADEPPVARRIVFSRRSPTSSATVALRSEIEASPWQGTSQDLNKPNVGTLFAEIRRLKYELDGKNDSILQLRQQLEVMRRAKDSATLSEKLRETQRDLRIWRHRAEWAESSLFRTRRNMRARTSSEEWRHVS